MLFMIAFGVMTFAQQSNQGKHALSSKKNVAVKKPSMKAIKEYINSNESDVRVPYKPKAAPAETVIGQTRYDLQTNQATQNRIYLYPDGKIGAVWTRGINDPGYADRGTGYNYYDGTQWQTPPTARIESSKTGWPSYAPLGTDGEIVAAHHSTLGLVISKRTPRYTGTWTESILAGPAGSVDISWPRLVTSGANKNTVHVIATTYNEYQGQDYALLYYRSLDGGNTWDQQHVILPGTGEADYEGYSGDSYAFAEPRGDTVAFVVADNWIDMYLMKSTDGGTTWNKTVIFQHPYPHFVETTTLVTDTPTVTDGSIAVALDKHGKAHVSFGLMRVLNDDLTDGTTSYFPFTDGLGYWNENMPTLTSVKYEDLEVSGNLIGWTQDINANDTILEFVDAATYYMSVTSMPNLTVDDNDNVYAFFTSIMEGFDNGNQNYRHVYGRAFADGYWHPFVDITGTIFHNFDECVFPNVAYNTDNNLHVIFQADEEPGLSVRGDEDPATDNNIIYSKVPKQDLLILGVNNLQNPILTISQNYPNPASGQTSVLIQLAAASRVSAAVYSFTGQKVHEINAFNGVAGTNKISFNLENLTPGVYFYTVQAGDQKITRKMIVQ